jgi:pyruvate/2-oxoglutarate/acetoin dehydrogenase E1 component
MTTYLDHLRNAMTILGQIDNSVFLGQAVAYSGTGMTATFDGVPREKLIEFPVAEDMQMGVAIGLAMAGAIPVCVYPRMNFLLLAINQLVNHLDKLPIYGNGFRPRVLVRVAVATPEPLDPGPQHLGDFSDALISMLRTVRVIPLVDAPQIVPAYYEAAQRNGSTVLVEYSGLYHYPE